MRLNQGKIGKYLEGSYLLRNASILMSGVVSAQLIAMLTMPLITRIYSPDQFAVLAVFSALLNILGGVACLRFEIAIPLPERKADGDALLTLALISAIVISTITSILLMMYGENILFQYGERRLLAFYWMIPLSVLFVGVYQALRYYAIRLGDFSGVAKNRLVQVIGCSTVQIALGLLGSGAIGLLIGQIVNQSAGILGLARNTGYRRNYRNALNIETLSKAFRAYNQFPKYSVIETLANNLGSQAPILIIGAYADSNEVAYLSLAIFAISAPMGLIGNSLSQAFLSKASEEFRAGRLREFSLDAVNLLIKFCAGPIICAGLLAPLLFPLVFGAPWARSGYIVSWMTGAFLLQIISSPISILLHVTSHLRTALVLQLFGAIIRVAPVLAVVQLNPTWSAETFALSSAFFYLVYFAVICRIAGIRLRDYCNIVSSLKFVVYWFLIGLAALGGCFAVNRF